MMNEKAPGLSNIYEHFEFFWRLNVFVFTLHISGCQCLEKLIDGIESSRLPQLLRNSARTSFADMKELIGFSISRMLLSSDPLPW